MYNLLVVDDMKIELASLYQCGVQMSSDNVIPGSRGAPEAGVS